MPPIAEASVPTTDSSRPARPALAYLAAGWALLRALWAVFNVAQALRQGRTEAALIVRPNAAPGPIVLRAWAWLSSAQCRLVLAGAIMVVCVACALLMLWGYAAGARVFLLTWLVLFIGNVLRLGWLLLLGGFTGLAATRLNWIVGPILILSYVVWTGLPCNLGALCLALWLFRQPPVRAHFGMQDRYQAVLARRLGPVPLDLLIGLGLPVAAVLANLALIVFYMAGVASDA